MLELISGFEGMLLLSYHKYERVIQKENSIWARQFFWVALAETVRLTSNSRTTTFKLHIRPKSELLKRRVSPKCIFLSILDQNLERLFEIQKRLTENNSLINGHYKKQIELNLGDSVLNNFEENRFDLMITSPPYGDNTTTVPYGQHSYLPLQWIPPSDIHPNQDFTWLRTTQEIDRKSLGGSRLNALSRCADAIESSPSLKSIINLLKSEPIDRVTRLAGFYADMENSITNTLKTIKPNGYMIWIVGNRRIAGRQVPINKILSELIVSKGATKISEIKRQIPTKRMASRNIFSSTMNSETILILRKKLILYLKLPKSFSQNKNENKFAPRY